MGLSHRVFVLSLSAVTALVAGCASSGPVEQEVLCEVVKEAFARKMDVEPLFAEESGHCRALDTAELEKPGAVDLFSDSACSTGLRYAGEPWVAFCENNLLGNDRTKDYIGNPRAWGDLDSTITDRLETYWSLSQGTTLHLATVNQTKDRHRPYLKKVEYREVDGCSLGMYVYKSDPGARNLKPVIFLHGGGWKYRGTSAVAGIETSVPNLTDKGYIVFAPFYRLLADSDGPAACRKADGEKILDDVEAAFEWVFANGERYGMSAESARERKVSVMGQSAGGHLAAYLAIYHPESVEKGILLYPAPDLRFFATGIQSGGLYGNDRFRKSRGLLFDFFPQEGVTDPAQIDVDAPEVERNAFPDVIQPDPSGYPALTLIHGDSDEMVPVELTTRLCQALDSDESPSAEAYPGGNLDRSCGSKSRLTVVKGAGHVLDLRCFSGRGAQIIALLDPEFAELCPAGTRSGSRKVRKALEAAYESF